MAPPHDRLTIVHVTTFYPPHHFGGDGVHVRRLAEAQSDRGHEVHVVCSPGAHRLLAGASGARADSSGGDGNGGGPIVHRPGGPATSIEPLLVQQTGRPILSRRTLRRLLTRPGDRPPDVIHYHNVSLVGGVGVLELGDAVKLYTPHEYWLACPTHLLFRFNREICDRRTCVRCTLHRRRPPQLWRFSGLRDRCLAHIDRMIYPSDVTRQVYRRLGIDRPGPVMHHFLPERYLAEAESLGPRRPESPPYFLYVGRLDAVKGIAGLARHFAERPVPAPLRVVGEGPLGPRLRAELGDSPGVELLGGRSGDALGALYRDALALILPSAGYEVLGLVVAEAYAHGTPAIVSDVAGARELVGASGAGEVFGSGEELDRALRQLASVECRDRLGAQGRAFVGRELTEEGYLDRYEGLVREVRAS